MFVRGRQPWMIALEGDGAPPGDPPAGQGGLGGSSSPQPPANPPAPPAGTLTQEQFNSALAARVEETRKATERSMLESLGITDAEEAKRLIAAQKAADDAQKTEAQRAREAADREKAEAAKVKTDAAATQRQADAVLALVAPAKDATGKDLPPIRPERLEAAKTLVVAKLIADDKLDMAAAVAKVREEASEFFGVSISDPTKPPAVNPGGAPRNNGSSPGDTGVEGGRARAKAEFKQQSESYRSPFEGMTLIGGPPAGGSR